ncbi:MAG TPA: hypothetical protein PLT82_08785 [Candidatus Hydrogenedens sp.]|nr:hypothetical protein [Candidatus Hydrogenedens sp.]HOK09503.1 hypothetical protein [Candidatus Hydrogenedens sp.]HOL20214.1 hypothetical protein [Candidatus Hydrogenedens sp.]HPP59212.1 hypothetical protein [Candidatus Hydrogenedens sp.]
MKHTKALSFPRRGLDWGLTPGIGGIVMIIQAIVSLLTAIGAVKGGGTPATESNTTEETTETTTGSGS